MDHKYEEALERARKGMPIDDVFPELKESEESKKERIRKAIIRVLLDIGGGYPFEKQGLTKKEALSYLEKQKEQKIARWKSLGECTDIPDGHHVVGWFRFGDFRLGIMCNGLFVDPNGNRAEQPKEVFYIPNADEEFVYAEQKQAEWSEEDKEMVSSIKQWLDEVEPQYVEKEQSWLDTLPKRLNLQPKPEWSEKDSKMIDLIIAIFNVNHPNGHFKANKLGDPNISIVYTKEIVAWLKSLPERLNLQPKQEWSEKDEFFRQ